MHWRAVSKYLLIIAMFDQLRAPCQIQYSKYFRSFQIKFTWCYSGLKIKIIIFLQHHSKYICQVPLKFIKFFAGNMQINIVTETLLQKKYSIAFKVHSINCWLNHSELPLDLIECLMQNRMNYFRDEWCCVFVVFFMKRSRGWLCGVNLSW